MPKGRPPKPSALRALDGGAGHRADDGRVELDLPAGTPEPPEHLSPGAKREFFRVLKFLSQRHGLLSPVDCAGLGIYCSYYDQWQQAELELPRLKAAVHALDAEIEEAAEEIRQARKKKRELVEAQQIARERRRGQLLALCNSTLGERNKARREIARYIGEFGFSPAARARIRVPNGQAELPLEVADPLAAAQRALHGA